MGGLLPEPLDPKSWHAGAGGTFPKGPQNLWDCLDLALLYLFVKIMINTNGPDRGKL